MEENEGKKKKGRKNKINHEINYYYRETNVFFLRATEVEHYRSTYCIQ